MIADKILFAGDPGKIEAERPRLAAPSAPGPSSAKEKHLSYIYIRLVLLLIITLWC